MMRAVVAASSRRELPSVAACSVRGYLAPTGFSFTEDITVAKPSVRGDAASVLDSWKGQAAKTAQLLQLIQTYKDIGDGNNEPYLKYHNPRTFEDLNKPVLNFRALNLKAGEVPKFFDNVLAGRAADAVKQKNDWWAKRKAAADQIAKDTPLKATATVPVPQWSYGKPVSMDSLTSVTDKYIASLEPKRKLQLQQVPPEVKQSIENYTKSLKQDGKASELTELIQKNVAEHAVVMEKGKPLPGFKYMTKALAAKLLAARRAEVHDRYVKHWAKKVLVSPELAAVPIKDIDAQLASKFENVAPAYQELLTAAGTGPQTLAQRVASSPAFSTFFLKRETESAVEGELPPSDEEKEGAALAAKFADPMTALTTLLGPELTPLGAAGTPLSAQIRAITEHKYTPDRYLYKEGMALAARLEKDEARAAELGIDAHNPPTPVAQVLQRLKEIEGQAAAFAAQVAGADSPYAQYIAKKKQEFATDATNLEIEELINPELTSEMLEMELSELEESERAINDAEEEELWALTLQAQLKHLQRHFGVDLPHGVIAYMDPILVKKIDWETTNNLEDWDISLEDTGSDFAKEQWGLESLSHHLLPLLRYRRAKARKARVEFDPELPAPIR